MKRQSPLGVLAYLLLFEEGLSTTHVMMNSL